MSASQVAGSSVMTAATSPFVSALRWYMRVGGLLLVLLALTAGVAFGNLSTAVLNETPIFLVGLGAFLDSFGKRISWLLGAVLALVWCYAAYSFLFILTGPHGPPVLVPILSVILSLAGIVIVPLAYRARE